MIVESDGGVVILEIMILHERYTLSDRPPVKEWTIYRFRT